MSRLLFLVVLSLAPATAAVAATYAVGPGQPFTTIANVPALGPGDVVEVHCGTYHEVRRWTDSGSASEPIVLRGVCPTAPPIIDGTRQNVRGNGGRPRALWQIEGDHYVVENLAFQNARNHQNGAGIRVLGDAVTIDHCTVTSCDMGVMSSGNDNLVITNSEIAFNGTGKLNGLSHNLYLAGNRVSLTFSYVHDAVSGENVKSRAHDTTLLYNYIADATESEVEGVDGMDTVAADSNMTMIGNIVISRPDRHVNTTKFIHFGADIGGAHNGTLYLINNTLVAGSPTIGFLRSSATDSAIVAVNNVFWGSDTLVQPGFAVRVSGSNNCVPITASVPGGFTATTSITAPGFVNAALRDHRLIAASPCRDIGFAAPVFVDGTGVTQPGTPLYEYVRHAGATPRLADATLDAGAYEIGTALPNEPPFVAVEAPLTATLQSGVTLQGRVADDGQPDPPGAVTTSWGVLSAPRRGLVTFADPTAPATVASFSRRGSYVLTLTASDGVSTDVRAVSITVGR